MGKKCDDQVDLVVRQKSGHRVIVRGCDPKTSAREAAKIRSRDEVQDVTVRGHKHGRTC